MYYCDKLLYCDKNIMKIETVVKSLSHITIAVSQSDLLPC